MPFNADTLRALASEIRSLPARRDSPGERLEAAGRLLIAAIDAGAFTAPSFAPFIVGVRQRREQEKVNGWISAWVEAVWWLNGKPDAPPDRDGTFAADCELVAAQILESARPAVRADDAPTAGAEQARAFLAWAQREIHDGVFLRGAVGELKQRVARLLFALSRPASNAAPADGDAASRLWRFFSSVDPRQQPVGNRLFLESFNAGEPTEKTLRDLHPCEMLSVGPPSSVDMRSWQHAVGTGFAGPAAVAELLAAVRELAPADEPRASRPPDLLGDAVAGLLRRIPERWAEYEADVLTATDARALFLLIAAGMVERRGRFRLRIHNHPLAAEATFAATGEYGFVEAMKYVSAAMWEDWKGAFEGWRAGETNAAPTFWCEHLKPDEWRLTDQGALARTHLDAGESEPLDFVLRRGFLDGQPRLIATEGRITKREAVRGAGHLVELRKVRTDSVSAASVSIANWKEGADAFAQALGPMLNPANGTAPPGAGTTAPNGDDPPTTKRDRRTKWLAEAMLLVRDHPDWSDREIAKRVGKDPATLSRSQEYQAAAGMARGGKNQRNQGYVERDADTGRTDIEAYADPDEDQ